MTRDVTVTCISNKLQGLSISSPCCPCLASSIALICLFHLAFAWSFLPTTTKPILCIRYASDRNHPALCYMPLPREGACRVFQFHAPISLDRFHSHCGAEPPGLHTVPSLQCLSKVSQDSSWDLSAIISIPFTSPLDASTHWERAVIKRIGVYLITSWHDSATAAFKAARVPANGI